MRQLKTKVVIIGAGPAGMGMALYLKRANIDFLLFEKGTPGGKLNQISKITNYLGLKEIEGSSLAVSMFEQLSSFNIDVFGEEVLSIKRVDNGFMINTDDSEITCKYVVIATGMIMSKLNAKSYDDFLHKGISSCAVCDGYLYKNKPIAIIGNTEIANKEYQYLRSLTGAIYHIDNEEEIVQEFKGHERLEQVITNVATYDVLGAFIYTDESINLSLIKNLNIKINKNRIVVDDDFMTDEKNVYAIGDAVAKKVYQIVGAINDASVASVSIIKNENN